MSNEIWSPPYYAIMVFCKEVCGLILERTRTGRAHCGQRPFLYASKKTTGALNASNRIVRAI
jgi:hypothetical protein